MHSSAGGRSFQRGFRKTEAGMVEASVRHRSQKASSEHESVDFPCAGGRLMGADVASAPSRGAPVGSHVEDPDPPPGSSRALNRGFRMRCMDR